MSAPITEKVRRSCRSKPDALWAIHAFDDARWLCPVQETHEGHSDALSFGFAGMQGWRVSMVRGQWAGRVPWHANAAHDGRITDFSLPVAQEDAHILSLDFDSKPRTALFSVFDGHGGKAVALYAAKHLVRWGGG